MSSHAFLPAHGSLGFGIRRSSAMNYHGFTIEPFEAGKDLWHARIRRADLEPVIIDGEPFPTLEIGFAWSNREAAIVDAMAHINRLDQMLQAKPPVAA
jgi:hypothetical protein